MSTVATSSPFLAWFAEWGQVIYAFAQVVFWLTLAASALIATLQYKRYVSHAVGTPEAAAASRTSVSEVEAFVE